MLALAKEAFQKIAFHRVVPTALLLGAWWVFGAEPPKEPDPGAYVPHLQDITSSIHSDLISDFVYGVMTTKDFDELVQQTRGLIKFRNQLRLDEAISGKTYGAFTKTMTEEFQEGLRSVTEKYLGHDMGQEIGSYVKGIPTFCVFLIAKQEDMRGSQMAYILPVSATYVLASQSSSSTPASFFLPFIVTDHHPATKEPTQETKTFLDKYLLMPGLQEKIGGQIHEKVMAYIDGHERAHVRNYERDENAWQEFPEYKPYLLRRETGADNGYLKPYLEQSHDKGFVELIRHWRALTTPLYDYTHATQFEVDSMVYNYIWATNGDPDLPRNSVRRAILELNASLDLEGVKPVLSETSKIFHTDLPRAKTSQPEVSVSALKRMARMKRLIELDEKNITPEELDLVRDINIREVLLRAAEAWDYFNKLARRLGVPQLVEAPRVNRLREVYSITVQPRRDTSMKAMHSPGVSAWGHNRL